MCQIMVRFRQSLSNLLEQIELWVKHFTSRYYMVRTVLKSPWILGEVLEKSLNSIFPWKVLTFLCKSFKSPWIFFNFECSGLERVFLMLFGCLRQNINHSSENLKVMFYAIINYQFKSSELKNVERLVKQTVQA